MSAAGTVAGGRVGWIGRRAWAAVPRLRGTQCRICHYEVPALGLPPDGELAWFERFENRPCPNCCGMALGVVVGVVLAGALRRSGVH